MAAIVIDGKTLAKKLQEELLEESKLVEKGLGRKPHLAVVLVGDNPASRVYVRSKSVKAKKCGLDVTDVHLPITVSDSDLRAELSKLSKQENIDGILLQLPLPKGLDEFSALSAIDPAKDVDGLLPYNQGMLLRGERGRDVPAFRPCTPQGSLLLIKQARKDLGLSLDLSGLDAVVIGRSILVGKPMGFLLLEENCTTTIVHSRSKNVEAKLRGADIVVAAVGIPEMVKGNMVKPGAIVIDVGINRTEDGSLVGDVDYKAVAEIAAAISPVPGGVGPMTITVLLQNTVLSAKSKCKHS